MCHTGCPYETHTGACRGRSAFPLKRRQPHCMDKEDFEAFVEDFDDSKILDHDLRKGEGLH